MRRRHGCPLQSADLTARLAASRWARRRSAVVRWRMGYGQIRCDANRQLMTQQPVQKTDSEEVEISEQNAVPTVVLQPVLDHSLVVLVNGVLL